MRVLLIDTNVVSILFKPDHSLYEKCFGIVAGSQWFISFMTRAELLLWPRVNQWGPKRRAELIRHVDLCTTLLPDEGTFGIWADIMSESRAAGRPISASDAWVAAAAKQWDLALVTADYRDFAHLDGLTLILILL
jgi:predicted nucleic acid-binding protein